MDKELKLLTDTLNYKNKHGIVLCLEKMNDRILIPDEPVLRNDDLTVRLEIDYLLNINSGDENPSGNRFINFIGEGKTPEEIKTILLKIIENYNSYSFMQSDKTVGETQNQIKNILGIE